MANDIVLGAKQIPNPKGIKVQKDTDNPPVNPAGRDISNPASNEIEKHPVDELFTQTPARRFFGHHVPKDHPAIQVSEN